MTATASVVADGRTRLMCAMEATASARRRRYEETLRELEERHREELRAAGVLRRLALRQKLREAAAATVRREFKLPSRGALFLGVRPKR